MDSSVPLMHHDPSDLGLICLVKKAKSVVGLSEFKNPILDFLKETRPLFYNMDDCDWLKLVLTSA